ncbi:DUF6520 family protein [Flavobacterium sp. FlaQc-47]|uniref:DUF6520 family protein n=1 Tax=Flavobacterium sp. FlaQc-47 TaxID=3374180 RepID=UPI00375790BE
MKTNFSKRFMVPLAVIILGGAGAFATTSMSTNKAVEERMGYRYLSEQEPCHEENECSTVNNNVICTSTVGSHQLFDQQSPNSCDVPLYKIQN